MTTVAFRVDASPRIGIGHVMRCLALGDALRARGAQTAFASAAMPPALATLIRRGGHATIELPPNDGQPGPLLQPASQLEDAAATLRRLVKLGTIDWIVVDHYRLGGDWEHRVAQGCRRVAVIDDAPLRDHWCDVLIDHNIPAKPGMYDGRLPKHCTQLLGPRYALLRAAFARPRTISPRARERLARLFVAFGGADLTCETEKALRALSRPALSHLALDVVVGAANPHLDAVRALARERGNADVHCDVEHVDQLMEKADLALGAAGVSSLERCAKGLPSLIITVADNQQATAQALAESGAAISLGTASAVDEARIAQAVQAADLLPDLLQHMAVRAGELCDGHGARRVAARLLAIGLRLRPARAEDGGTMLAWRNDARTRSASLDPRTIDKLEHARWFAARLDDREGALLIAEDTCGPVAVLRYDTRGDVARVSVYLAPERHGEGLGACVLAAGHRWLSEHRPAIRFIDADVLAQNEASRLAFAEAGYRPHHVTLRHEQSEGKRS